MNISKQTKITLLLLSITTMMSNVAIVTSLPHLKEYFTTVENIEFLSRMMLTLPSLSIAFLAPILGHIVYKIGRKKSAFFALLLFAITGTAGLYLDSMESLLASRAALGIAIATLMIVSTSLVGDYFVGEERHKFMGLQSAFIAVGGILFVVGGGVLSDLNWRYAFGIYAVGLLLMPLVAKYLVENVKDITESQEGEISNKLFPIYFLAFLHMTIFFILPTQFPFLLIEHFKASGTVTGSVIALAFVCNAIGAITFAKLKKKFSFATIYIIGMAVVAIGFLMIGSFSEIYQFYFAAPVLGFGGGILTTNISAWMLSRAHSSKRVKSSGYLTSSLFLGQFFSPIVFHPVVSHFGVQDFFLVISGSIAIGVILSIFIFKSYSSN